MTGIEIVSVATGVLTAFGLYHGYNERKRSELHKRISDIKDKSNNLELEFEKRVTKLEKDNAVGEEKIKSHILNCANWQPRHKSLD